ncbi:MAG: hypothetical protein OXN89_01345 [Bryobacterales bacterium]|nr:hypothetical protein [Bryobacterales bacterium]
MSRSVGFRLEGQLWDGSLPSSRVGQFDNAGTNGLRWPRTVQGENQHGIDYIQLSLRNALTEVVTIGLDLGKTPVYFVRLAVSRYVLTRRRYSKGKLAEVTAKMVCRIGMEAC